MIYTGQFVSGTFPLAQCAYEHLQPDTAYYFSTTGNTIKFDTFDTYNKIIVSGSFSFTGINNNTGQPLIVKGSFQNLTY